MPRFVFVRSSCTAITTTAAATMMLGLWLTACGNSGKRAMDAASVDGPVDAASTTGGASTGGDRGGAGGERGGAGGERGGAGGHAGSAVRGGAGQGGSTGGSGGTFSFSCGAFSTGSGWTTAPGFRAAVVAVGAPLVEPVALTFSPAGFGVGTAIVVDQRNNVLLRLDTRTGAVTPFVADAQWPTKPALLTTIVADTGRAFDGALYVGDQGSDGDGDSKIFRITPEGAASLFAQAPGAGLDDVYGLAFSPGGDYPPGLYVSGDTDGAGVGVGRLLEDQKLDFAPFGGIEGLAVDFLGRFGGGLFASAPAGGGYGGDDTLSRISPTGEKVKPPLLADKPGIHAIAFAPLGPFGGDAYVASWASGNVLRVKPDGSFSELASGLSLTNYDGNILAFSPDGRVLFVADRLASRIVCIEAAP